MVNTLKSREEAWLTVFDRSDNANLDKVMQISINTYRWTAFAFNGLTDRTTYKGSTLFFNQPTRSVRATACGKGCYVTGFSPLMEGTRTDKDENGTVTGTVDIAYDINFRTVRFETNEQINALGTTVMVVTHEKELVNRFTKRVVAINEGLIISDGMDGYYLNEEE